MVTIVNIVAIVTVDTNGAIVTIGVQQLSLMDRHWHQWR
jgi:hypothetical protein